MLLEEKQKGREPYSYYWYILACVPRYVSNITGQISCTEEKGRAGFRGAGCGKHVGTFVRGQGGGKGESAGKTGTTDLGGGALSLLTGHGSTVCDESQDEGVKGVRNSHGHGPPFFGELRQWEHATMGGNVRGIHWVLGPLLQALIKETRGGGGDGK